MNPPLPRKAKPRIILTNTLLLLLLSAAPAHAAQKVLDVTALDLSPTAANTSQLQKAIDDLSTSGGGTLHFPAGNYLTGTLQIKSNITLHLDKDATLRGSTNADDYRNLDPFTDGSGHPMGYALLIALDADHIAIEGLGTINGQGPKLKAAQKKEFPVRPFLTRFVRCHDITLRDVHLTNGGAWTLHLFQSKNVAIDNLTIRTRDSGLQNTDGIDVDSSENIRISHCDINTRDDAIVLKSTSTLPTRHVSATDCTLSSRTNALKLGTESLGGFDDISFSNCTITNTQMAGIALYAVDGGDLQHVHISNITMDGVEVPISIRLGARLKTFRPGDQPKPVGHLRDISIQNISAKNIKTIGLLLNGIPDHPIENLSLNNITLQLPGGGPESAINKQLPEKESAYPEFDMFGKTLPSSALYARHVQNLTLTDIHTSLENPDPRPPAILLDIQNLIPKDFTLIPDHFPQNP